jgi:hypothetical protein
MPVKHLLSNETLFCLTDSTGNPITIGQSLYPTTLYNCRRFSDNNYSTLSLYGAELTPTELA